MVCVAPSVSARSRLNGCTSVQMSGAAPALAAITAVQSPMAPEPSTTALSPALTLAVLTACRPTASGSMSAPSCMETASGSLYTTC